MDENGYYDTEEEKVDFLFFGYVVGHEAEVGYFSLSGLNQAKDGATGMQALPIEQDLYFTPRRLSEIKNSING